MVNNKHLIILSVLVIFLSLLTVLWKPNREAVTTDPDVQVIVLQKDKGIKVYLNGKDASSVSVFETTVDYNKEDIEIESAGAGGFFVQPLVISSNIQDGLFSFAFNPSFIENKCKGISANLPVLTIEFSAKNDFQQAMFSLKPDDTQVYIFDKGVFSPKILEVYE